VPIAISVITGKQAEQTGAFNVNRIKELVPSVQLYSSNPRNTGINIRSLGSPFGLTNDGIDPGALDFTLTALTTRVRQLQL
jgi:iron complex outermembrane receptor protein